MYHDVKAHHAVPGAGVGTGEELPCGVTACLAGQGLGGARQPLRLWRGAEETRTLLQQSGLCGTRGARSLRAESCRRLVWPRPGTAEPPMTPVCCIPFPWGKGTCSSFAGKWQRNEERLFDCWSSELMLEDVPKPLLCLRQGAGRVLCTGRGALPVCLQASCGCLANSVLWTLSLVG